MLEIIVLGIATLVNILLGIVVFTKNPRSITNRLFLCLTATIAIWSVVNYVSVHPTLLSQLTWVRLVLLLGALLDMLIYLTFLAFPASNFVPSAKKKIKTVVSIGIIVMGLTLTPLTFSRLKIVNSSTQPVPGKAIFVFMLYIVTLLTLSIYMLFKKYKRSDGRTKDQFRLIILGIVGTFSLIVITNFLLVVAFNFTGLLPFGPAFTLIFSGSFAYAIVKHKLFDIRAATARGLAYLLSFGTIGLVYGGIVFGLTAIFNLHGPITNTQRAIYIAFAIITALIYPRTKKFFDRITEKLFYRDAYDPQALLDGLNKTLVSTIELDSLLYWVSEILAQTLKAEFVMMGVKEVGRSQQRVIGTVPNKFKDEDIKTLRQSTSTFKGKVIMADELSEKHAQLHDIMRNYDVAMVVRLAEAPTQKAEGLGYILLGNKLSGNLYSNQDTKILEIIADELVIAVQNALRFEEIQNFAATLQAKVTEATKQLRHSNEKLKQMDETKDDFISMASHQLRTPLTSVKGYVSMVLDGDAGKITAQQRKLLDQSFISSQRMVYLIADLLNVSRLKTGKFVIDNHPTNLSDVVESELSQLTETAKGRGLKLVYEKPKDFPSLELDETKVRQVIMNFADNAIYYTPDGGTITVALADKPSSIELTIADNGIGVPKAMQHHLFTKFYRADNAKKARPDGTGLGLFMAKKVIAAQGGALIFHSEEGKGSTFGFSFPKTKQTVSKIHGEAGHGATAAKPHDLKLDNSKE
jgi:signal transduction histidine kinase